MARLLFAGSLAAIALATSAAMPAGADNFRSRLDDDGKRFGTVWTDTGRFEALTAAGMDDVSVTTGDSWRIRATGDTRALAQLRFMVEDGALIVGRIANQRDRYGKAKIEVTAPALRGVTAAGSGMVEVEQITGDRASATVAGSGRTTVRRVDAQRLSATIAGSGGLGLSGRSTRADVTIAGSGQLAGENFTTQSANITVAGSGGGRFRSPGEVSASIVGSGTVTVTGTTACRQTRMGSGRLVCAQ